MKTQTIPSTSNFIAEEQGFKPYAIFLCDDLTQNDLLHPEFQVQKWFVGSDKGNTRNAVYTVLFIKTKQVYSEPIETIWYEFLKHAIKYVKTITNGPIYFSHESGRLIPILQTKHDLR